MDCVALGSRSRVLAIVPLFHANSWGLVFATPMMGACLVLPGARPCLGSACTGLPHILFGIRLLSSTLWSSEPLQVCEYLFSPPSNALKGSVKRDTLCSASCKACEAAAWMPQSCTVDGLGYPGVQTHASVIAGPHLDGPSVYHLLEHYRCDITAVRLGRRSFPF